MDQYQKLKSLVVRRQQLIQQLTGTQEHLMKLNLSQIQSIANIMPSLDIIQDLNGQQADLKPKQDIFIFPKQPKQNPEEGEVQAEISPNYSLQQGPSSCELSPLNEEEQQDLSFQEIAYKFFQHDQIELDDSEPVGVYPKQFMKSIPKSNHPKEILIMDTETQSFKDSKYINEYLTNLFYFTSKLRSSVFDFKISKIKHVYFNDCVIIKFGDYLSCQFIYFSLVNKHYIHSEAIGQNYKQSFNVRVYYVKNKNNSTQSQTSQILLRNLEQNITKSMIDERFQKLIAKPLQVMGPLVIDNQSHAMVQLQSIEECEQACKLFNKIQEFNKITCKPIKANISCNSNRKRSQSGKKIFQKINLKKFDDDTTQQKQKQQNLNQENKQEKQKEKNKEKYYEKNQSDEKYNKSQQNYTDQSYKRHKEEYTSKDQNRKIIYEYEKYEKKKIIIQEKTSFKNYDRDHSRDRSSCSDYDQKRNKNYQSRQKSQRSRSRSRDNKSRYKYYRSRSRSRDYKSKYNSYRSRSRSQDNRQKKYKKNLENLLDSDIKDISSQKKNPYFNNKNYRFDKYN